MLVLSKIKYLSVHIYFENIFHVILQVKISKRKPGKLPCECRFLMKFLFLYRKAWIDF